MRQKNTVPFQRIIIISQMNGDTIRSSLGQIFQEFQDETVVQQFIPDHQRALKKIKRCCIYPIYHFTLPMKIMSSLLAKVQ